MIIYNITVKLERAVKDDWLLWVNTPVARMMGCGLFLDYRLFHLLEQEEWDGITYVLQFSLPSIREYDRYQADYAPVFRQEYGDAYRGRYVCFRTVMEAL